MIEIEYNRQNIHSAYLSKREVNFHFYYCNIVGLWHVIRNFRKIFIGNWMKFMNKNNIRQMSSFVQIVNDILMIEALSH